MAAVAPRLALVFAMLPACAFEVRAIVVGASDRDVSVRDRAEVLDAALPIDGADDDATVVSDAATDVSSQPPDTTTTCMRPNALCGGRCVDPLTSQEHCGGCGNPCAAMERCIAGRCLVPGVATGAGNTCTRPDPRGGSDPAACGAYLVCIPTGTTAICSHMCTDNLSQAVERAMCGGGNGTCLVEGDPPDDYRYCTVACAPGAARGEAGACRSGFVCTGWWLTHDSGRSDAPGCAGFCAQDSDCYADERCNTRLGRCGIALPDLTRLPDGAPCDPTRVEMVPGELDPRNTQCRGACFQVSNTATQGLCGSLLDLAVRTTCPDDPAMEPDHGADPDNLALCLYRACVANRECRAPLICRYDEDPSGVIDRRSGSWCQYPTAAQSTGLP